MGGWPVSPWLAQTPRKQEDNGQIWPRSLLFVKPLDLTMTGCDTHSLFEHRVLEVCVVRATATTDCLVAGYDVGFREASVRLP